MVRPGGFHTKTSYLACTGARYKDAGLADIVVESRLVASGSLNGAMNGHHYSQSVRTHKITSEALQRLRFQQFLLHLTEEQSQASLTLHVFQGYKHIPDTRILEHFGRARFGNDDNNLQEKSPLRRTRSFLPELSWWEMQGKFT